MHMNYFAYGSNMNWGDLDRWCEHRGFSPIDSGTTTQLGVIKNYKLTFNYNSISRKGGALNIVRHPGSEVGGVLFNINEEDYQKIVKKEGSIYRPIPVNVFLQNGEAVGAKTFKAEDKTELYPPTDEYLEIVLVGAEHFGLREKFILKIKEAVLQAQTAHRG